MSENKVNFILAVRGYKNAKKEKKSFGFDVTAADCLNKKVLLRVIEPSTTEYIGIRDVRNMSEYIKQENYDSAILISKQFTDSALDEMNKQHILHFSEDSTPPFEPQELYLAIIDFANTQCQKKCSRMDVTLDCKEEDADTCKIHNLAKNAKGHFEDGMLGLLKNDLRIALALR
jgi:hypothetical protein